MKARGGEAIERPGRRRAGGFLRRLRRDQSGNTLALMAMSLIPIAGMIGSGLDMSRAYMTKAKLQNACDAAALATRRFMAGNAFTDAARAEGQKFFDFNFPDGTMGSTDVILTIAPDPGDASRVQVSAETAIPTTVMRLFGQTTIELAAACEADQDFVNNDIMLVLDVTGSMYCTAGDTSCQLGTSDSSGSRLSRLRNAAASLYQALEGAQAQGARIRYGFMPYSMTVNVGRDLQQAWITDPAKYSDKDDGDWHYDTVDHTDAWFTNWRSASSPSLGCVEERRNYANRTQTNIKISSTVDQEDIDTVGTDSWMKWQPYDDVATQDESDPNGSYSTALIRFCPKAATRLAEYTTESAFQTRVNFSLERVGGYTNHDLGIVWGARYLSSTGMFQADNPTLLNDMRVDKHIVFLTDGVMTAGTTNYSSFGIPAHDQRMTGTVSGDSASAREANRHKARFLNACNRARQMGMTIWVIALDVQAPDDIRPCASGSDHFYQVTSGNQADLDEVFELIGKGIGKLRVTE